MTHQTDSIISQFNHEIRSRLGGQLKKVILFGSKARGDDVPGSDYDCLVVVDEVKPEVKDVIDEIAGEFLFEHNAVFSIFPIAESVYLQKLFDPFLKNIRKEGVAL
jgi:predicted nucleotidyltransferase